MNNEISSQILISEVTHPSPDETRRQELAREYEAVPSAQAFIAVCDRLIAAERERDEAALVIACRTQPTPVSDAPQTDAEPPAGHCGFWPMDSTPHVCRACFQPINHHACYVARAKRAQEPKP